MDTKTTGANRQDRLLKEEIHDPYMARSNPKEPTVCGDCGVVFAGGRWTWQEEPPTGGHRDVCPACQRIRDKVPAGILTLKGDFFREHRREILNLIDNKVAEQNRQHPLKRLMAVEDQADGSTVVTFTDTHLPRGAGQAIERAYEGDLDIQYTEASNIIRVYWER